MQEPQTVAAAARKNIQYNLTLKYELKRKAALCTEEWESSQACAGFMF